MKTVRGSNVKVMVDSTGGFISVDWTCPYCNMYNAGYYFRDDSAALTNSFEIDEECDVCEREVTIQCYDPVVG